MAEEQHETTAAWLEPPEEQQGLQRYIETLRERAWLIVLVTALTTAVAIAYVLTAPKVYQANANLLISPVSPDNTTLTSLGLIAASPDPTRDVETAAQLVTTTQVAQRAIAILHSHKTPQDLLDEIQATPVAESTIIAVTAKGATPDQARDRANAFGQAVVAQRTETLHRQIDAALPALEAQLSQQPRGTGGLGSELSQLELLRAGPDPTFRLATPAQAPKNPSSPRPVLSVVGGLFAGLVLGIAGAFALQMLDPRLRREEQLRRRYRLPILARIPKQRRRSRKKPIGPGRLARPTAEAYRTLRTTIAGDEGRTILVTGSSASEGKTTSAINLASALALIGKKVILIEADLRRPSLGNALNVEADRGVVNVLIENTKLEDALVTVPSHGVNLSLLLADYEGGWIADLFAIPAAQEMLKRAQRLADYVIVDSPPLNEVVDALPMARAADDVLIVVRLGHSRLGKISNLCELLAESGVRPIGFAVVGTARPGANAYAYHSRVTGTDELKIRSRPAGSETDAGAEADVERV